MTDALIRLPHSGMHVPATPTYTVTSMREHTTRHGVSYTATLRRDGKIVGTIENEGHGGSTEFFPAHLREHPDHLDREVLYTWAAQAREEGNPDPVSYETVLEALITEYEWPKRFRKAAAKGRCVARQMAFFHDENDKPDGTPYEAALAELAARLAEPANAPALKAALIADGTEPGTWWQIWDGNHWRDATDRPAFVDANLYR